jgi:hypothetical protein
MLQCRTVCNEVVLRKVVLGTAAYQTEGQAIEALRKSYPPKAA